MCKRLHQTGYDVDEIAFLEHGLTEGLNIGYEGPTERRSEADNMLLKVGSHVEMWNKLMKEILHNRVARPFEQIPFRNFIQSQIGLVP